MGGHSSRTHNVKGDLSGSATVSSRQQMQFVCTLPFKNENFSAACMNSTGLPLISLATEKDFIVCVLMTKEDLEAKKNVLAETVFL